MGRATEPAPLPTANLGPLRRRRSARRARQVTLVTRRPFVPGAPQPPSVVTALEAKKTHACSFVVPPGHPALPGHFPGHAVVPGVVIVDRVIDAAEDWLGRGLQLARLPQAKFVAPLHPGERADVTLTLTDDALVYAVHRDGELLGRGTLILQSRSAS